MSSLTMETETVETVVMECSILGCITSEEDKPVIYPYPKESKLRSRWSGAAGRSGSRGMRWSPSAEDGVCARHFAPEHYLAEGELREDAVPALHLPPRGLEAEMAVLCGVYSTSTVRRLALVTAHRPVLLLQPPPPPSHPSHAAHRAALTHLASELHLRPDRAQSKLDRYINDIYERILQWCRLRAKYELGTEERAGEVAPEWLRLALEVQGTGGRGRGVVAALWRGLAAHARELRSLEVPGGPPALGPVWTRGVELARSRLELLTRVGDDEGALHPGARPTFDMEDLVLLLSPEGETGAAGGGVEGTAAGLALTLLFGLVQKYRLEEEEEEVGEEEKAGRGRRWSLATREYRARHRAASVLLLQRRWHRLKVSALRSPSQPPLHAALLRRFPHLYSRPPLPWPTLVAAGEVVEYETPCSPTNVDSEPLEDLAMRFQEPTDDDDVILIERHIDTYEISDDEEEEEEESRSTASDDVQYSDTTTSPPPPVRPAVVAPLTGVGGVGEQIDVKLTLSPVVVVREVTSSPGWRGAVRGGRYVDLRRLRLSRSPPHSRRSIANTIVFEDDDDDDEVAEERREPDPTPAPAPETRTTPAPEMVMVRKKVQLPDIEQVRIQNRNMLTAEVLPCPAGTGGGGGGGGVTSTRSGSGSGCGSGRYCCWALRSRAVTAARARHAHTSGRVYRHTHTSIDLHRSHCKDVCECCCAGAERGMAGAGLAAEQRALDDRLLQLQPEQDAPPPPPQPPPLSLPTVTPGRARPRSANRPHKQRTKKRRTTSTPPPPSPPPSPSPPSPSPPPSDDLQEWIRQKNLTARFFDLNLKRPSPAPAPAAAAGAGVPIIEQSNTILPENVERRSVSPPPPPPSSPPPPNLTQLPVIKVVSTPATLPPRSLVPVRVVSMPPRTPRGPVLEPPRLEMMSVSEDEDEEGGSRVRVRRRPRPRTRAEGRPDRGDTVQGMKIVAIREDPVTGQRMIVVQPAQARAREVPAGAGARLGVGVGKVERRSRPAQPTNTPHGKLVVVARKVIDTEMKIGSVKSTSRAPESTPGAREGEGGAATCLNASHSNVSQHYHSDDTDRQVNITSSPGLHSDRMLTVAPVTVTATAAPMTLTVAPISADVMPVTVTAADEQRDRATTVRPQPASAPVNNQLVFQAIPSAFEDFMFKDTEVKPGQVSWAGRPLVMSCCRLQAPWAPLLGWYMLTEEAGAAVTAGAGDVDYWVFGETMYRLESLPAEGAGVDAGSLRIVHGVPDARSCRSLAVRGVPLLALHLSSRRVLRVAVRRHGDRLLLRAAATHLAERLAEALNAAPAPAPAPYTTPSFTY